MIVPNMSKRHFDFLAEVLGRLRARRAMAPGGVREIAEALRATNEKFDLEKFCSAVEANPKGGE